MPGIADQGKGPGKKSSDDLNKEKESGDQNGEFEPLDIGGMMMVRHGSGAESSGDDMMDGGICTGEFFRCSLRIRGLAERE